ncbi:MAG: long-chain fatty acid--CoA ligase [Proteobacteria bacterium]|nr:long-chain fatty acid--CoA ligase [Pseudomonadota bacterium]NCA27975.1 long-chain fatty acid--CoA ligase [Pseudomonadota bacterium]
MYKFANLAELLAYQRNNFNNPKSLNFKENDEWKAISNHDFFNKAHAFARALKKLGLKKGDVVANYSYQNPIWLIVDFGSILAGGVSVPIFNNISRDHLFHQLQDSKANFIFTDNPEICHKISLSFPHITIISYGLKPDKSIDLFELILIEEKNIREHQLQASDLISAISSDDLATIVYTSGSTDKPKGVEISHHALVSQIHDSDTFFDLKSSEIILSYLPLAHIFERMVMCYYISKGLTIYFVDDIKKLGNFLKEIKPSLMTSVPRALEKVFIKIKNGIDESSLFKKIIGKFALQRAIKKPPLSPITFYDKIFDKIIYSKFRQALGGNINMIICGGSPLSQDLENFYWNIGVKIYCGYGLTETSPVLATNCPKHHKFGSVGKAFPSVTLKVANDSELLAKGVNVFKQYHNQPKKTQDSFIDGWFKTGDLASIDNDGFVKIIGRKKELFKTSNGKFVNPVLLEQKLIQEITFLSGALIIAEGKNFVSALLFVDFEMLHNLKQKLAFNGDDEEFFKTNLLDEYVQKTIDKINKNLDQWEQIKKFKIIAKQISIETGEITPSLKLKRNILEQKFANEISQIYQF